ncbi:hypothetical protein PCK1_001016 [Pneumocystis canis]|nr:hypothetical protein PCK1_001016 [Pneumocystis canis]
MDNLLFFLNQENGESNNALCEKMHNETCNYFKNLTGNSQYDCNDSTNTCTELEKTLKENLLQKEIKNIELFSKDNKSFPEASLIDWPKLNPNQLTKNKKDNFLCPTIQMSIKPYQERKDLESALKHELKGGLGEITHCNYKLDDYCIKWAETGNHTLINLCRVYNTKTNETGIRNDLKYAEEAMKNTNLVFLIQESNPTGETKCSSTALVRQSSNHPTITGIEINATDLVAIILDEYIELKQKCKKLLLDCGFKKECPIINKTCKKIQNTWNNLEPLILKLLPMINTISTTTTITSKITETVIIDTQKAAFSARRTYTSTITLKLAITYTKECQPTPYTTDHIYSTKILERKVVEMKQG